jgi:hypothetical protein
LWSRPFGLRFTFSAASSARCGELQFTGYQLLLCGNSTCALLISRLGQGFLLFANVVDLGKVAGNGNTRRCKMLKLSKGA